MTREEKIKAFEMRMDGATLQQIGNEFGVTREYIRQVLTCNPRKPKEFRCIFPGLKEWMTKNEMSCVKFALESKIFKTGYVAWEKFTGVRMLKMPEIKAILAYTGMTFEEAFGREESPGADVAKEEAYAAD